MALIICPKCGKENKAENKFCSSCGAILDAESEESMQLVQEETAKAGVQQSDSAPVKQSFFRKPAGKVLIIAIIVAIVIILLVVLMWHHSRQIETKEKETDDGMTRVETVDSYILPESDQRYYTEDELNDLSASQLRLARNEIYARHGRIFDSADLQDYFENLSWYSGTIEPADFSESLLNEYEKANIKLIQSLEDSSEAGSAIDSGTNSVIAAIPSGQSYSCDLNGDGINETVSVKDNPEQTEVQLLINGKNCATIDWAWWGVGYIVNVDSSDGTHQIGVQYTTDDDYTATVFYSYDFGGVHLLSYIPGSFYGSGPYPNITCTGDGTIQSYKALDVFETWFANATWMLRDGHLVELVPSVYEPLDLFNGSGINLTVIQSIEVTKDEPYSGDWITLPVGTKVHMAGTDNCDWVSMTADGYNGTLYLQLYDGYQVFLAGTNEKIDVDEVFNNLSIFG